jgi:LysR family transcriptional activator of nhaA
VLTDTGQMVFGYAEEIFTLGGELMNAVKNRPTARAQRLTVGLADSFPKLVAHDILQPLFALPEPMHVICREGKIADLLAQLALHRLDVVLADEPASSSHNFRSFNHLLAKSPLTFCAAPPLGRSLRRKFPKSLHGAPALMPSENTPTRRALEKWFQRERVEPRVIGEFDDAALMSVVASGGAGFIAVPSAVAPDASARYGFELFGTAKGAQVEFYAITAERRIAHPGVVMIAEQSPKNLLKRRSR